MLHKLARVFHTGSHGRPAFNCRWCAASDAVVVCLSTSALGRRGYVHNELRLALRELQDMPVPDAIFVLPVRIDDCEVPRHVKGLHYVNYWEPGAIDRIIASLHTIRPMRRTSGD
jgi:hypothetical protein